MINRSIFLKGIFSTFYRRSSIEKHREYKEKYTERDANKHDNRSRSRESRNSYSRYRIKSLI